MGGAKAARVSIDIFTPCTCIGCAILVALVNVQTSTEFAGTLKSIRPMSKLRPLIVKAPPIIPPSNLKVRLIAPGPATTAAAAGNVFGGDEMELLCFGRDTRILMASTSVAPPALPIPIPPCAVLAYRGTSCPAGIALKSTNTSARSPGPNASDGRATGTASSPASLATCSKGSELPSRSTSAHAGHAAKEAAKQVIALADGGALYLFDDGLMAKEDRYGRATSVKVGTVIETKDGRKLTMTSNEVARLSQLLDLDHRG